MKQTNYRNTLVLIFLLLLLGCGSPKQHGYVIKPDSGNQHKGTALLLHAAKNFPIKIISINGTTLNNAIRTSTSAPTYIELNEGAYELGLSLSQGHGQCGRVMLSSEQPFILKHHFVADKVYLLQRKSEFESGLMCDPASNTIRVKFYIDELPALPYDDVRSTFSEIDLSAIDNDEVEKSK